MINVEVKIGRVGDPPLFPQAVPYAKAELKHIAILEKGMKSGKTSIWIDVQLADGKWIAFETSAALFLSVAGVVKGAVEIFEGDKGYPNFGE